MKKFLKYTGITLLVLIALFFIIPLFMANDYHVEKSTTVDASIEETRNYMKDFSKFEEWSPWAELDPDIKIELKGNIGEVGSIYSWSGNDDVGVGSMEITNLSDNRIDILLKFKEPFESESKTYYELKEKDGKTEVTWGMDGSMPYPWNIFQLFMSMEDQIGKDFDKGLNKLKKNISVSSSENGTTDVSYSIEEIDFEPRTYIGVRDTVAFEDIATFYEEHFPSTLGLINEQSLNMAGAPSGLFFNWMPEEEKTDMAATIPIVEQEITIKDIDVWTLSGKALKIEYYGDYSGSGAAHEAMEQYIQENNIKAKVPAIEEYVTDPGNEPDTSKWLTNIYYFIE